MGRRKTCDLCTVKKIRCDGGVPACSYCTSYAVACKWTPGIHKLARPSRNRRRDPIPPAQLVPVDSEVSTFADGVPLPSHRLGATNNVVSDRLPAVPGHRAASAKPSDAAEIDECVTLEIDRVTRFPLPALEDVEPLISSFFIDFNQFFPIFESDRVTAMVNDWYYSCPGIRDEATWAVINIIIALGLQFKPRTNEPFRTLQDSTVYVANAQSVLDKLVMWVDDCKGIQVLLGLVVYFQKSLDRSPAQVLIASTTKLAFRLRLHMSQFGIDLPDKDIQERKRLFWATYILDRDISMRVRDPYILHDHDFDIEPLDRVMRDEAVCDMTTLTNTVEFNYFRCRADLAFLQGKIHDWVNSVQAGRLDDYQKWEKRETLWTMLNEWANTIPQIYHPSNLAKLDSHTEQAFISLYITRFRMICGIEKVFANHTEWITGLIEYSTVWSEDGQTASKPTESPLPHHWKELVESARTIMLLFRRVPKFYNGLLGNLCCSYFSALLVIVANKLALPESHLAGQPEVDEALIVEGIVYMEDKYEVVAAPTLKAVSRACRELNRRAGIAVVAMNSKPRNYQNMVRSSALAPRALQTPMAEPCRSLSQNELQSAFVFSAWDP